MHLQGDPERRHISVVVPMYNEVAGLPALMARLAPVIDRLGQRYDVDVLFVDDGSLDGSYELVRRLAEGDPRVHGLQLSRNFGSHLAITAGLEHATGDAAIILTADLQEPPERIPDFVAAWEDGHEIVWGIRSVRADPGSRDSAFSKVFTAITRSGPGMKGYPRQGPSAYLLLDRVVIEAIRGFRERNRMILGMIAWTGFRGTTLEYEQAPRATGSSGWSVAKKIKLTVDALVSFSYAPIRTASLLGVVISTLSLLYAALVVILAATNVISSPGFPTLLAVVLFLGGVQLLFLGILGEYLWRALDEARGRPPYIVRDRC